MEFIELLHERLQQNLPGIDAQMKMAPPVRTKEMQVPDNVRLGAVMILLLEQDKTWHTILIRRTEDGQTHSGQISFPGGKMDQTDEHLMATALRECEEEIGVKIHEIEVLGNLSPLFIPPSNFLVTPTVGLIKGLPMFKASEKEVQEIIKVPLDLLFDKSIKSEMAVRRSDNKEISMLAPAYTLHEDIVIWGATAMMISELETLLAEIKLNETETK
ncbi:MAG: CoA pyrophosphatase [Bacteroidetes bacterium]|nr:CoA pyrophosphatase [Bacteroidota bacterium]